MTEHTFWYKQESPKPLFPDLLWSRPEQRNTAGKLLIIGGNLYGFAAPALAYAGAIQAGIGTARVLLPQAVKKTAGNLLLDLEYVASTPSGSFSQAALSELEEHAHWSDGVLFAGDLGHNSETAVLVEKFLSTYTGQVTLTQDAADYCLGIPEPVLNRPGTLLVLTMAQLQKLAVSVGFDKAFTLGMDLLYLVENLHAFSMMYPAHFIVKHGERLTVAVSGQISTTRLLPDKSTWRVKTAAYAAVWWLQNPSKPLEALSTAVYELANT